VHRLDQLMRNLPAKLLDYKALTLKTEGKQIWTGKFTIIGRYPRGRGPRERLAFFPDHAPDDATAGRFRPDSRGPG
jgi:hypothetical protein